MKLKLFIIPIICMIFLVSIVSAAEFDNVVRYQPNDKGVEDMKVSLENWFGLGETLGILELKSHSDPNQVKYVPVGNSITMWYDLNFPEFYANGLGEVEFTDVRTGELIERNYSFVYYGQEQYEEPTFTCSNNKLVNGTIEEDCVQNGTITKTRFTWLPYNSRDIPKGNIRIGIQVEVREGDYVDGVWNIGGERITKHASWNPAVTDAHGVNLNLGDAQTRSTGVIILTDTGIYDSLLLTEVGLGSDSGATVCYLLDAAGTLINTSSTVVSHTAGFYDILDDARTYRIECDDGGGSYFEDRAVASYPYTATNIDYVVGGSRSGTNNDSGAVYNIVNITTATGPLSSNSPIITLTYPTNNSQATSSPIEFSGVVSDDVGLQNASLFIGGVRNQTNSSLVNGSQTNFTLTLSDGTYDWYYDAYDNESQRTVASGMRFSVDTTNPTVTLNYPTNTTYLTTYVNSSTLNINLNATETDANLDTCWVEFTNGTNQSITCNTNKTLTGLSYTQHTFFVWANDTHGNTGHDSVTANWEYVVLEGKKTYNLTSAETATETFLFNLTSNGSAITSPILSYNGTNYSATVTNTAGNNYNLSRIIQVPLGEGNKSFTYYFTLGGATYQTYRQGQDISPTFLTLCNATYSTPFLNLTFKDEGNQTNITANIPSATITYSLSEIERINKTYTFSDASENSNYTICGTPTDKTINTKTNVQYSGVNYPQRIYEELVNYTSTYTNKVLYLLKESDGIYVTFQVVNLADQPINNVNANATRTISSVTELIGIGTTGADGGITFFLNPDFLHTFGFSKTGFPTLITSLFPTQTSYTITLGTSSSTTTNDFTRGINYSIQPKGEILNNDTFYNFNFSLTSTYWTVDKFGFNLRNSTNNQFNSTSLTTNGGFVNSNLTIPLNTSDIIMDFYWVVDGNSTNGTYVWTVYNTAGTGWGLNTFFTDLNTYVTSGLFDLDSFGLNLIIFSIIFIFTGIFSYKYGLTNPATIMGILFSLTFFFDVVLGLVQTPTEAIPHFPTVFVAIIMIGMLFWERAR